MLYFTFKESITFWFVARVFVKYVSSVETASAAVENKSVTFGLTVCSPFLKIYKNIFSSF